MAIFTAFNSVDMSIPDVWSGSVTIADASHVQYLYDMLEMNFYGSFTYDSLGDLQSGIVTSMNQKTSDLLVYEISELNKPASILTEYIETGDVYGLLGSLLSENDILKGSSYADVLFGFSGKDSIRGNDGDDVLYGGIGRDTLKGGPGDDIYLLNDNDIIIEFSGQGTDLVMSTISHALPQHVENLSLGGLAPINGTGNDLDNVLTGNEAANILNGAGGSDTLRGGGGDDIYVVNGGDTVVEFAAEGIDLVRASVSYTLPEEVENLKLTGSLSIKGTGNTLDNALFGNGNANFLRGGSGDDVLKGGDGNDTLKGGADNDTYIINGGDTVIERPGEGMDLVVSTVSYTLPDNVENLILTGSSASKGVGNELDNLLYGNDAANILKGRSGADAIDGGSGNDLIRGGGGNDTLNGGSGIDFLNGGDGEDLFVFNTELASATNIDTITDFLSIDDVLELDNDIFTAFESFTGTVDSDAFVVGDIALDSTDRIIYDQATGGLFYDPDGAGGADQIQFAVLGSTDHPVIDHTDIVII